MRLTEHAGKALLAEVGIPVPPGLALAFHDPPLAAPPFAPPWRLKSQVLSGGRGKAGGVVRVESLDRLAGAAGRLFALPIGGMRPPFLRLEPEVPHERAVYLSLSVSRSRKALCLSVARQGGVDVEALAGTPELLIQDIPPPFALAPRHLRAAFFHLELESGLWPAFADLLTRLARAVSDFGLLLAEINPLAVTDTELVALDAKLEIDEAALAASPALARFADARLATPAEREARSHNLAFVSLDGRVGLVANGAGLAMATMDALAAAGLPAANFLDFGGTADAARLTAAFALLFADPAVEAVCINLFGGILSCAAVAEALGQALGSAPPPRPIVARLAGNGAAQGASILRRLELPQVRVAEDMDQALALLAECIPAGPPRRMPFSEPGRARLPVAPVRRPPPPPSLLELTDASGVLVQGITGRAGRLHARLMRAYGTNVACGVTPFKGGQSVDGVPVYDSVVRAVARHDIALSVIFVPAAGAADAILEAAEAGIPRITCITDGIAQKDMLAVRAALAGRQVLFLGPNTPGVLVPGRMKAGIMPVEPFSPGPVAVFSRSGTLTYEVSSRLSAAGMGQAAAAGIGGDPFGGAGFTELCEMVRDDDRVRAVVVIGEVGGGAEEELADYVAGTGYPKPVVAFIAGLTAPPGRTLGHAGALLERPGGVSEKIARLAAAGITVCPELGGVAAAVAQALCCRA